MAMVLQHQTADELYSKQLQIRSEHVPVLDSVGHVTWSLRTRVTWLVATRSPQTARVNGVVWWTLSTSLTHKGQFRGFINSPERLWFRLHPLSHPFITLMDFTVRCSAVIASGWLSSKSDAQKKCSFSSRVTTSSGDTIINPPAVFCSSVISIWSLKTSSPSTGRACTGNAPAGGQLHSHVPVWSETWVENQPQPTGAAQREETKLMYQWWRGRDDEGQHSWCRYQQRATLILKDSMRT